MSILIYLVVLIVAVLAVYLAILATWTLAHDSTIPAFGRAAAIVGAWLLPVGVAVWILRSAAEFSPESLPSKRLLWPVFWLLHANAGRPNNLRDEGEETFGISRRDDD